MEDVRELDLYEHACMTARQIERGFQNPDDDWAPVACLEQAGGVMGLMPLAAFMDEHRKVVLAEQILPMVIRDFRIRRLVIVLSAWTVQLEKDENVYGIPPSRHPRRSEGLFICEYTPTGIGRYAFAEIKRDGTNPPTLGEWETKGKSEALSGLFVEPIVAALSEINDSDEGISI